MANDNIQDTDKFLVNRSGNSYQIEAQNIMADLQDTDLMLVNRGGTSYKAVGADIKESLKPPVIIAAPTVIAPPDGQGITPGSTGVDRQPKFVCSEPNIQRAAWESTDWQISDTSNFSNIIVSASGLDNRTEWDPDYVLEGGTTYYVRVRHNANDDDNTTGPWGTSSFKTVFQSVVVPTAPGDFYWIRFTEAGNAWSGLNKLQCQQKSSL